MIVCFPLLRCAEPLYRIGFSPTAYTVSEGDGTVSVTVELLAGELSQGVPLSLVTADGTAMGMCVNLNSQNTF